MGSPRATAVAPVGRAEGGELRRPCPVSGQSAAVPDWRRPSSRLTSRHASRFRCSRQSREVAPPRSRRGRLRPLRPRRLYRQRVRAAAAVGRGLRSDSRRGGRSQDGHVGDDGGHADPRRDHRGALWRAGRAQRRHGPGGLWIHTAGVGRGLPEPGCLPGRGRRRLRLPASPGVVGHLGGRRWVPTTSPAISEKLRRRPRWQRVPPPSDGRRASPATGSTASLLASSCSRCCGPGMPVGGRRRRRRHRQELRRRCRGGESSTGAATPRSPSSA